MAYNTKEVLKDVDGNPISQYYDPVTDSYKPVEGSSGGNKVTVENNDLSLIPILDKLGQLTGTVIDEETRKSNENTRGQNESTRQSQETTRQSQESTRQSNENTRNSNETSRVGNEDTRQSNETIRQNNMAIVQSWIDNPEQFDGRDLEFNWSGTSLGVRLEGDSQYVYIDLKGDTGSIENLTSQHVTNALGYNPISPTQLNSKVQTDVPLNAKFTDTITTKTSELTNDSGFLTSVTKSDVGLGNVTNDKQMPISGGVLENYREKLTTLSGTSTAINLSLGNVFTHTLTGNTTYTISNAVSGQAHSFTLIINMGSTVRTITFPASVKWQGGEIPDMSTVNKTYVLTFMTVDGGTTWLGMFGGEF